MPSGGNQRGEAEGSSFTLLGNKAIKEGERGPSVMISHGVEISIAGGVGEKVRV